MHFNDILGYNRSARKSGDEFDFGPPPKRDPFLTAPKNDFSLNSAMFLPKQEFGANGVSRPKPMRDSLGHHIPPAQQINVNGSMSPAVHRDSMGNPHFEHKPLMPPPIAGIAMPPHGGP